MAKTAKRSSKKRRGPGRPPTTCIGKLIGIRCHKEFLKRVDRWRADKGGISRPEAILLFFLDLSSFFVGWSA
jgi:hypothetical protein